MRIVAEELRSVADIENGGSGLRASGYSALSP
jgi:hypothetical protein